MKRLTRHRLDNDTNYVSRLKYLFTNEEDAYINGTNKLGQLEDIEQELCIELSVLFKAIIFNEDIWCVNEDDKHIFCTENECALNKDKNGYYLHIDHIGIYYLKDYGKTWALTKEELEK